ncbi:MAG: mechanosensitive ion channel [Planctomycetaceae bacterium]|nr:mechanosensitive ion channel [Planctomycetaceae bacterium]
MFSSHFVPLLRLITTAQISPFAPAPNDTQTIQLDPEAVVGAGQGVVDTGETVVEGSAGPLHAVWDWLNSYVTVDWVVEQLYLYGGRLLAAVAVFVIGKWLARRVTNLVVAAARRTRVDETLLGFMNNLVYLLLLMAVCISSLKQLGVDTNSLTAILAAAGFAVGMAAQGSLGNLAAGFMLMFFKPFRVGNLVEVNGNKGTVVEIQLFNTILLTPDNVRIIVPNSKITDATIQNFSAERERRIDLVVGCGYNDDLRAVKAMLQRVVTEDARILTTPAPVVAVLEMGASSVNFVVRPWVRSADYWPVRFDLVEKIKLCFDEEGFTIPFPSQDLFIHPAKSGDKEPAESQPEPFQIRRAA